MPELPEVETVAGGLRAAGLAGVRIAGAIVRSRRTVEGATPAAFAHTVRGRTVASVGRRAKYLVLRFAEDGALLLHLRMTGRLHLVRREEAPDPYECLRLLLEDGRALVFHDTRRFGRCQLVADPDAALAHLGPEPLDDTFTVAKLRAALSGHRRQLKPLLLDQRIVAGLGNIYVDEALWEARLHPRRLANTLPATALRRLHAAIRTVLRRGIAAQGTSLGDGRTNFYSVAGRRGENSANLRVFRRDGQPCPRCRTVLRRIVVGQRGTHLCPCCQPAPNPAGPTVVDTGGAPARRGGRRA